MIGRILQDRERSLRFLMAGGLNTAFGLAFYPLLLWLIPFFHVHYLIALGVSQAVSLCFAYWTYKFGVFRTRGNVAREFGAFSTFYLVNFAANWLALPALVEIMHIPPMIAQLAFTVLVMVGSYFWHSRVTFVAAKDAE
jgi:putative flippase GtrA